jgi:hypothetical protein
MNNRENKMALRKIVLLLLGIGLLLLVVCLTLSFYSYRTMPHFSRPETGYIYPLHLHGTTVYVSELASDMLLLASYIMPASLLLAAILVVRYKVFKK